MHGEGGSEGRKESHWSFGRGFANGHNVSTEEFGVCTGRFFFHKKDSMSDFAANIGESLSSTGRCCIYCAGASEEWTAAEIPPPLLPFSVGWRF